MSLVLAETVSFSEEEMLLILLVLVGIFAAGATVVTLGCVWAWMAGRGSQLALAGWVIVGSLEALAVVVSIPGLSSGPGFLVILALGVIALQVALYLGGRSRAPGGR